MKTLCKYIGLAALVLLSGIAFSWKLGPQLHLFQESLKAPVAVLPRRDPLASGKWEMIGQIPPDVPAATTFGFFAQPTSMCIGCRCCRNILDRLDFV